MKAFSALYGALESTASTKAKVAAMVAYFSTAEPADAAWAVYFLAGYRLKRLLGSARLREWLSDHLARERGLPGWLVDECYSAVGDLAETIALLVAPPQGEASDSIALPLADWIEQEILSLRELDDEARRERVTGWWRRLDRQSCFLVNKLLTGSLRVGVAKNLLVRALAETAGLDRALIAHRLAGQWRPSARAYRSLLAADDGAAELSRPYPFFLASPLEGEPAALGPVGDWQAEWKWDGIRAQLLRRQGRTFLWSRGGELIGEGFPEIAAAAAALPDGCVLDGEILAWDGVADAVLPFAELQKRIGRKKLSKNLLASVPVVLLAYDLLELGGEDLRGQPLRERRRQLQALFETETQPGTLKLSEPLVANSWQALAEQRENSRQRRVEGLMLKALDSVYGVGRPRGSWWKWKIEPLTIDAVLIYAQAGHGRRAGLFTDYTFAVWRGEELVPIAKAYSGLSNQQIERLDRWVRRNTLERFGPVRSVPPTHVFELACEGITASGRHKSGIALRFPRILRWREDLGPGDADTLCQVQALLAS